MVCCTDCKLVAGEGYILDVLGAEFLGSLLLHEQESWITKDLFIDWVHFFFPATNEYFKVAELDEKFMVLIP